MKKTIPIIVILLFAVNAFAAFDERPLILISNDDGYDTPGISALALEFSKFGQVIVVAPLHNASGVGHGITYKTPISFGKSDHIDGVEVYWVDALPASCVRWALDTLFKQRRPDLVISGINSGENVGMGVYYSGTVGAAREAAFTGTPAIAVSMASGKEIDLAGGAAATLRIARIYLTMPNPPPLLNINLPAGKISETTPVKITHLTLIRWEANYDVRTNPRTGGKYFWITFAGSNTAEPGSDSFELEHGAITITPLIVDVTSTKGITDLTAVFKH